jgi:hypothetical protein
LSVAVLVATGLAPVVTTVGAEGPLAETTVEPEQVAEPAELDTVRITVAV